MLEEKDLQKMLNIVKRIQFQLQYTLSDLYKCGLDTDAIENMLISNIQEDNKKAPR